jgi:multidrug transporter EmrE-like cation transporter
MSQEHAHVTREGPYERMLFIIAVTAGTMCSIFSKLIMETNGIGRDGKVHSFDRPLALTWGMFVGMIIGLPLHAIVVWWKLPFPGYKHSKKTSSAQGSDEESTQLLPAAGAKTTAVPNWMLFYLAVPAMFDLFATAFSMIGLLYLDVSVYQLLRGSGIAFVAILKRPLLNQRLYLFQWIGVGWNIVAISLVGLAAVLNARHQPLADSNHTLEGILFMLLASFIQSLQFVFEEKVMTTEAFNVPPLLLFGMEGFWGTLICSAVLTPIAMIIPGNDHGSFENPMTTWELLKHSPTIQIMFSAYIGTIFAYNLFAVLSKYSNINPILSTWPTWKVKTRGCVTNAHAFFRSNFGHE